MTPKRPRSSALDAIERRRHGLPVCDRHHDSVNPIRMVLRTRPGGIRWFAWRVGTGCSAQSRCSVSSSIEYVRGCRPRRGSPRLVAPRSRRLVDASDTLRRRTLGVAASPALACRSSRSGSRRRRRRAGHRAWRRGRHLRRLRRRQASDLHPPRSGPRVLLRTRRLNLGRGGSRHAGRNDRNCRGLTASLRAEPVRSLGAQARRGLRRPTRLPRRVRANTPSPARRSLEDGD